MSKQDYQEQLLRDGALQLGRLTGPTLEAYARTFAALAERHLTDLDATRAERHHAITEPLSSALCDGSLDCGGMAL